MHGFLLLRFILNSILLLGLPYILKPIKGICKRDNEETIMSLDKRILRFIRFVKAYNIIMSS